MANALLQQPLSTQVNIVDEQGRPTPQFARMLQKLGVGAGLTTSNGMITLATMAAKTILANKTAGTAGPTACTLSDILDFVTTTQGSILFRGASGWQALTPGTSGQVLQTNGPSANPSWVTPAAGGGGSNPKWDWAFAGAASPTAVTGATTASLGGGSVTPAVQNAVLNNYYWFNSGQTLRSVTWDLGSACALSGFIMYQDVTAAQGTWQPQYSDDNITFTDIGTAVAWSGTITTWSFTNTTVHRYWRLNQTSGTTNNASWQRGTMFRWP